MSNLRSGIVLIIYILILAGCKAKQSNFPDDLKWEFEKIESSHSKVDFRNDLTPNLSTKENLFDFDYFYNGAGVSVIDLNNDGLEDLIFTGNQRPNELYLNKGNFEFENITETSGINVEDEKWSNSSSIIDINEDGWLDIYISQGGPHGYENRSNLLFINNKDLTFTESAAEYGLDDKGISTNAAFFDFDKDGDLDCFVLNESELYGYDPISFFSIHEDQRELLERSFSHLYRNDNGVFTDISSESGIVHPTFGLGVAIADFNVDGWLDIYVANDYFLPDNLYVNRGNGTFNDRIKTHFGQTAFFGMGVDVADINNDGHTDVFVLDMASDDHVRSKTLMASMNTQAFELLTERYGFIHQYMFNALQLSNGQGRYNNISHQAGVAKTNWSWAPIIEDLDLDGDKDVFITNGYRKYALDNDFKSLVTEAKEKFKNKVPLKKKQELYNQIPSEALPNVFFENTGDLNFRDIAKSIGLGQPTFSNGAAMADLDNDGDLDLVINNLDEEAHIYRNNASSLNNYIKLDLDSRSSGLHSQIDVYSKNGYQNYLSRKVKGYRSSSSPQVVIGLGDENLIDSLVVTWLDGTKTTVANIAVNQTIKLKKTTNPIKTNKSRINRRFVNQSTIALGLPLEHVENKYNDFHKEILLPQKQSTLGPRVLQGDFNNDNKTDLWIGGSHGSSAQLHISNTVKLEQLAQPVFEEDKNYEDLGGAVFDLEGDGDLDLYVISGGNEFPEDSRLYVDRLYVNNGSGVMSRQENEYFDKHRYSGGVAKPIDLDNDGLKDLIVGNRILPQSYPVAAPLVFYKNVNGHLVDQTSYVLPKNFQNEIVNDIEIADFNFDGLDDIMLVGEWSGIRILINSDGKFVESEEYNYLNALKGWWYSITPTDIDNDGLKDFVIGNVGRNIKHKASIDKPLKVYAQDFDESGSLDVVLSNSYKGREVPTRGKECSTEQMPYIGEKFETYKDYALASIVDIYGSENIEKSYTRSVTGFSSILLKAEKNGSYQRIELPPEAQIFPLLDAISVDINSDGYEDLLCIGNIYETEVETPRLDGGSGLVLLSDGRDNYNTGQCPTYCFGSSGNIKDIELMNIVDQKFVLTFQNNGPHYAYKITKDGKL